MLSNSNPPTYLIKDAAVYLGISVSTLYKYNHEGKIAYYSLGRFCKYKKEDLDAFIESQRKELKLN
jgi:excisionase family DNA binding protein